MIYIKLHAGKYLCLGGPLAKDSTVIHVHAHYRPTLDGTKGHFDWNAQ